MQNQTLANDYGGPFHDARPVKNPKTQLSAAMGGKLIETVCQSTFTSPRTTGTFTCTTTTGAVDPENVAHESHWGSDPGTEPAIEQTATGLYTMTFPASFTNGLGESETISLSRVMWIGARTGDAGDNLYAEVLTFTGNVVTLKVESPKGTLADQGNSSSADIVIDWAFR